MKASKDEHLDVVKLLLDCYANVNAVDCFGRTALRMASEKGYLDIVNRLLDCKEINVNRQDEYGRTALTIAARDGHVDVVNRLLDWQKAQIHEGFELVYVDGSLNVPLDIVDLIIEFTL